MHILHSQTALAHVPRNIMINGHRARGPEPAVWPVGVAALAPWCPEGLVQKIFALLVALDRLVHQAAQQKFTEHWGQQHMQQMEHQHHAAAASQAQPAPLLVCWCCMIHLPTAITQGLMAALTDLVILKDLPHWLPAAWTCILARSDGEQANPEQLMVYSACTGVSIPVLGTDTPLRQVPADSHWQTLSSCSWAEPADPCQQVLAMLLSWHENHLGLVVQSWGLNFLTKAGSPASDGL